MASLKVIGGRALSGRVAVEGNKNSALPLIAACVLTDQPCEIRNVPRIRDVDVLLAGLLGIAAPAVLARLAAVSGGNPLFVEELVAMLVDDGVLRIEGGTCTLERELDALTLPAGPARRR